MGFDRSGGSMKVGNNMQDGYVSRGSMVAGVLWTVVCGLIVAAWVVILAWRNHWHIAGMLAASGCALSALAATLHIKTYACRLSRLVRVSSGLEGDVAPRPRSLR